MKLLVRGDLDGFCALALDNLINLLLISGFCLGLLQFSPELFYGRMLPAVAVSLLVGNLFYSWQARRLAQAEGRDDVCALPYGLSLFTVLAFSLLVMLPAQQAARAQGLSKAEADLVAWRAGIAATLCCGLVEASGAFFGDWLRRHLPRAALLCTPAMVGLLFISGDFFFKCAQYPLVGFTTLGFLCAIYYGRLKLRGGLPASLVCLVAGTALAWALHREGPGALVPAATLDPSVIGFHLPVPMLGDLWAALPLMAAYLPIALPQGLLGLVGSLQSLESAAAAGDNFKSRPSLLANGLGTLAAALFGSPYPTTLYYGHPGWKALGARTAYSTLNALFFTVVLLTGTLGAIAWLVPLEAGMAILVWIGATIFIQAFSAVPAKHYPAVTLGMLPVVGALAALVARHAIAATGTPFSPELLATLKSARNFAASGVYAIEAGYIFMSVIWAAAVVCLVERRLRHAALWMLGGAALSAAGLMHSIKVETFDVVAQLRPAWAYVGAYLALAAVLAALPWVSTPDESPSA